MISASSILRGTLALSITAGNALAFGASDDVRWTEEGITWWVDQIAIGDDDSVVFAARHGEDSGLALHALGSQQARFRIAEPGAVELHVDVAARAPSAVALVSVNRGSRQDPDLRAQLRCYSTHGNGDARWTYDFPNGLRSSAGAGVAISRDGSVVVALWPDEAQGGARVESFDADGRPLAQHLVTSSRPSVKALHLDDAGTRVLFQLGSEAVVLDLATGTVESRTPAPSIWDPLSFSGDGERYAHGYWDGVRGYIDVQGRDDAGRWSQVLYREFRPGSIVTDIDLDRDGDRVAFFVQDEEMESVSILLADVDRDRILMRHRLEAPGTSLALFGSEVALSEDGSVVAAASWGDDAHLTPETLCVGEDGSVLASASVEGSARHLDLASDGSFMVFQNSGSHATQAGGNRNTLRMMRGAAPEFEILGEPRRGGRLDLAVMGPPTPGRLFIPVSLGSLDAPIGGWRLDLAQMLLWIGPVRIDGAGWSESMDIPDDPALDGVQLHLQGALTRPSQPLQLTNKVSLRMGS